MGTLVRITVYTRNEPNANRAILAAQHRFEQLDQLLSDYKPDSELNRLCRTAYRNPTRVSPELFTILTFSQRLSLLSGGAFDVTIGARTRGRTGTVGYQHLSLGNQTVTLLKPDMQLDLGAIAKGYATDEAAKVLNQLHHKIHLIAASGDIRLGHSPPSSEGWQIGIGDQTRTLHDTAISTAGNTYQPRHIIDPRTLTPVTTKETITVRARNGITSDALDTTCLILSPGERTELFKHYAGAELIAGETSKQLLPAAPTPR